MPVKCEAFYGHKKCGGAKPHKGRSQTAGSHNPIRRKGGATVTIRTLDLFGNPLFQPSLKINYSTDE